MKKYKIILLIIFIMCLSLIGVYANNNVILIGKRIYIDPGHGGVDPGAVYKDIKEEDINLQISLKIKEVLEKRGAIVYLTRDGDYDLSSKYAESRKRSDLYKRSELINNSNCDLYLSIHLNAETSSTWSGAQVFYDDINKNNIVIAKAIMEELQKNLGTNREAKEITTDYLYKHVTVPGVLIEVGFLSNSVERAKLQDATYQYKIANTIANGIEEYIYKN